MHLSERGLSLGDEFSFGADLGGVVIYEGHANARSKPSVDPATLLACSMIAVGTTSGRAESIVAEWGPLSDDKRESIAAILSTGAS